MTLYHDRLLSQSWYLTPRAFHFAAFGISKLHLVNLIHSWIGAGMGLACQMGLSPLSQPFAVSTCTQLLYILLASHPVLKRLHQGTQAARRV